MKQLLSDLRVGLDFGANKALLGETLFECGSLSPDPPQWMTLSLCVCERSIPGLTKLLVSSHVTANIVEAIHTITCQSSTVEKSSDISVGI